MSKLVIKTLGSHRHTDIPTLERHVEGIRGMLAQTTDLRKAIPIKRALENALRDLADAKRERFVADTLTAWEKEDNQ